MSGVALVHEWMASRAGSEKTFEKMSQTLPNADLYALTVDESVPFQTVGTVRPTVLQRVPVLRDRRGLALPIMPVAWRFPPPSRYDVVITSSHAFARYFPTRGAVHLSYVYTPLRYAWLPGIDGRAAGMLSAPARALLRWLDRRSTHGVSSFAAISTVVQQRIERFYERSAKVVFPPVDIDFFRPAMSDAGGDYVLGISRWIPYKRLDLALRVADKVGLPAVIAGSGPQSSSLRRLAEGLRIPVRFEESPDDTRLRQLYQDARVVIFPAEEDFGIVAVEAQACGTPVVALARGGSLDTVRDGVTGVLVESQDVDEFAEGVEAALKLSTSPALYRAHVDQFSHDAFVGGFTDWIAPWIH